MNLQAIFNINKIFFNSYLFVFTLFLPSYCLGNAKTEQLQSQILQINQNMQTVQDNIAHYTNNLQKIQQDSLSTALQIQGLKNQNNTPLSSIDQNISSLYQKIEDLKKKIAQARQDSAQNALNYASRKQSFNTENARLQQLILSVTNDIKNLNQQREQHLRTVSMTTNNAATEINTEIAKIDLQLANYHNELNNLKARRAQMVQDSTLKTAQLQNNQSVAAMELKTRDSLLGLTNQKVQELSNRLTQLKKKHADAQMSINTGLQNNTTQRARVISSINLNQSNLNKYKTDYNQTRSSLDATLSKYEQEKAPLEKRLRTIDSTLQTRQMQKSLWSVMEEKITVDSSISVARNELDQIIQEAALKRKNGMKMSEQKEAELNALMGKADLYLEKPGVKQASTQLASLTFDQKRKKVREFLTNIENDIKIQSSLKQQALAALTNYEKNNPVKNNPSMQKLKQLENQMSSLQSQQTMLVRQKDSLDAIIVSQTLQINQADAQFRKETGSLDSSLSAATRKSIALSEERNNYYQNHSLSQKNNQDAINQITYSLKETDNRIATINREITLSENRKQQLKTNLTNSAQLFEQQKTQASASAQSILDMVTRKEQEKLSLSNQIQQLSLQHNQYTQQYQTSNQSLSSTSQTLNTELMTANAQYQNLLTQKSNLNSQLSSSQTDLSRRADQINKARTSVIQQIYSLQNQLRQLSERKESTKKDLDRELAKEAQYTSVEQTSSYQFQKPVQSFAATVPNNLQPSAVYAPPSQPIISAQNNSSSVQQIDSLIRVREQELSKLRAQRDKVIKDSISSLKQNQTAAQNYSLQLQTVSKPATAIKTAPVSQPKENREQKSQRIIEKIYSLLGEGKNTDAYNLFTSNKEFLKSTAPVEAIRILESSFTDF